MFEFRVSGSSGHAWSGDVLTIGRDPSNGWVLSTSGVWARHAEVLRGADGRLTIRSLGDAVVALNGVPVRESPLRWGDSVSFGTTVARFHLAAPDQRGLFGWQRVLWITLGLCLLAQAFLLVWLQR
ncbi:MAG: FHA domain-containing protein [Verrucomicrobiota bacterium]|jgi:predicted component of type VI protein secretion system|nr:FHA domain-containing protein [Verrucomicrobiota bacterium]